MSIIVYSQPGCGPCIGIKMHLKRAGVPFVERNVRADPEAEATVRALGYTGTPVVVAGDKHIGEYREDWLDAVIGDAA